MTEAGDTTEDGFLIGALLAIPFDVVSRRVQQGYAAAGFPDLRPAHGPVFAYLEPAGNRVTELAARARMTKQSMGYLVADLEARGYVERVPDPRDGRAQLVRRTAKGWAVNRTARRLVREVQDEWAAQLGAERMRLLLDLLRELVDRLGVAYVGSAPEVSGRPTP